MRRVIDEAELVRWRALDASVALVALAQFAKRDASFDPIKNSCTTRWHCRAEGRDFELLLSGTKFFDTRAEKGGGGAIDLTMHLLGVDFKAAVHVLRRTLGDGQI